MKTRRSAGHGIGREGHAPAARRRAMNVREEINPTREVAR
jgi:hypothetical protein